MRIRIRNDTVLTSGLTLAELALTGLVVLALAGCRGGETRAADDASSRAVAVRASAVVDTILARPITAAGTVTPKDEIALSFTAGGVVARIEVDLGDRVRAGQTLAALDLREIQATLTKTQSGSDKAERDLARARRLYADSVMTLVQLQDAETAAEQARADVQAAGFNRRYAVITAASDGTVLRRLAEPGETVAAGEPVLVVGSRERGNVVEVGLADRDVVLVREGDPAVASFDALPGESFTGEVTQVAAAADPGAGTYSVEVALRNGDALTAGLVGRVEIRPLRGAPVKLVPIEAVLEADGGEATVFALTGDGERAQRRRVSLAFIDGARVAVTGGLEGTAAVLTEGAAYLEDGSAVEVVP